MSSSRALTCQRLQTLAPSGSLQSLSRLFRGWAGVVSLFCFFIVRWGELDLGSAGDTPEESPTAAASAARNRNPPIALSTTYSRCGCCLQGVADRDPINSQVFWAIKAEKDKFCRAVWIKLYFFDLSWKEPRALQVLGAFCS